MSVPNYDEIVKDALNLVVYLFMYAEYQKSDFKANYDSSPKLLLPKT